jgi:hypothetical protein
MSTGRLARRIGKRLEVELDEIELVAVRLLDEGHGVVEVSMSTGLTPARIEACRLLHRLVVEWELAAASRKARRA